VSAINSTQRINKANIYQNRLFVRGREVLLEAHGVRDIKMCYVELQMKQF
jgi:hypothetical protein